ncbi:uridine kinase family protein [Actinophytocola glycyrrhizae]|uniref:Uridine kinase n=1 Tax=Actinophytocola glycyrrhizae TaxID=2044873 RepID=A0ABV9S1W9_9PSEU
MRLGPPRLGRTTLIAVDGPSGSGKTSYAARLAARLGATVVSTDDFATWDDPVSWWPRLVADVLDPLENGRPGRYRTTEWTGGRPHPGAHRHVAVPDVLVVEGVSAGRRSITGKLSCLVWCEVPDERTRLERAVARDGEQARKHLMTWQDFERGWFAVDGTRARADVLDEGSDTESLQTRTSPPSTPRG